MPENSPSAQGSWERLPEPSAAALRQALMRSLELQNPRLDSPAALRAGVKEAIAKNKLQEVIALLDEDTSEANRTGLESLKQLLEQEAKLFHFEAGYEKQMTPKEQNAVVSFLKRHRLAIAIVGIGLIAGWQAAGIATLFSLPEVISTVRGYFASASSAVQGWWASMQGWLAGNRGTEAALAAGTNAGQVTQEIVRDTPVPYEETAAEVTEPSPSDRAPGDAAQANN